MSGEEERLLHLLRLIHLLGFCFFTLLLVHTIKEVIEIMSKDKNKESLQEKYYVGTIGIFGGFFSAVLAYIAHFFNFIPFGPGIILQTLPAYGTTHWMRGPSGHLLAILLISFLSIAAAYVYYLLLRRMNTAWVGLWFGFALWVIIFLGFNQLIPGIKTVRELGWNTNIALVCIFLFYGLFVGYSISYQYQQLHEQEEA